MLAGVALAAGVTRHAVAAPADSQPAPPPAAESQPRPRPDFEVTGAPGSGVTLKVGRWFSLNIRSRLQVRAQLEVDGAGEQPRMQQSVSVSTARVWFAGHVLDPSLTYMIQLAVAGRDFREGAISPVYDAYVDWQAHRNINLRVGQFFVPFDRLRTVRESATQMVNRPVPVLEMTLDRDVGLVLYSDRFLSDRSPVAWRLGVFGGGGTNLTRGKPPGALVVARLELRPLGPIDDDADGDLERRHRPRLALGIGGAANVRTDRLRSTTGPVFLGGTATYAHAAADLVFKFWGLAIQGEYLRRQAQRDTIASTTEEGGTRTEFTRSGQAWIAQASYVFPVPVEVVGRLSAFYPFRGTDPVWQEEARVRGQEIGGGLNYYFNAHKFKVQAAWSAHTPRDFAFDHADHTVAIQLDTTF